MKNGLEIHVSRMPAANRLDFYMKEGSAWVVDMTLKTQDEGSMKPSAFSLDNEEVQALMDRLWGCGFRPTEGTGSAGALAATERHLEDMRKLVFPPGSDVSIYDGV